MPLSSEKVLPYPEQILPMPELVLVLYKFTTYDYVSAKMIGTGLGLIRPKWLKFTFADLTVYFNACRRTTLKKNRTVWN